ncbi:TolC family outer membrane protein [Oricola thermophila]|uniref:TolC family outer membrane protein n=1 Tax=Oricola thermophila TaxID=2742145 RepID=A0A6N1VAP4_9HYPH|nr:TolC family outer membrane protein [Oricola thermophila]QKV17738.1 TolC family outer membrane protein [Oricola thermophila]
MRKPILALALAVTVSLSSQVANAENIFGALAKAYENNSELNAARAGVRIQDESVALAKSGYRPRVQGTAGITNSWSDSSGRGITSSSFGIEINQSIFDGFQTRNNVRAARSGVLAERENLRNTEQNVLFDTAQAYMDVVQNRRIAEFRQRNLAFLEEQVRAAQARFEVGEGTRTDVEQAKASRAAAVAQLQAARAAALSSAAVYRQLTGSEPGNLEPASALTRGMPRSLEEAQKIAFAEHPAIRLRNHLVDSGLFSVKAAEGAFMPQVGLSASVSRSHSSYSSSVGGEFTNDSASIGAQVTVPIYQGGQYSATVRQKKEQLGQARINMDVARDQVRAAVASAWTQLQASQAAVAANRETLAAARLALDGVIQERDVGQRTTLDVLNAQADVLSAQIALVQAERDVVVSSYALRSAMGRLTAERLGLKVALHDPKEHYEAVADKWYGLRTPDGR